MGLGSLLIVLHSHLPYYRKHGMWPFGEENLYECMAETYIPLLNAIRELQAEGIKANITLGLTPILCEQLADPDLQQGFIDYINTRLIAARKDVERFKDTTIPHAGHLAYLSDWYIAWFESILKDFTDVYHCQLLPAFKALQDDNCIEIITSGATHGFSPLLGEDESIMMQFKTGCESYKQHFGQAPKGMWLPECAYRPDMITPQGVWRPPIEAFMEKAGLKFFFVEYHAIEGAMASGRRRGLGMYQVPHPVEPLDTPLTGLNTHHAYWLKNHAVSVIGRNDQASYQVWSADYGYPGDGLYREFHRKDTESGMHYWRLTSKDADIGNKMLYDPELAEQKAVGHANHYAFLLSEQLNHYYHATGKHGMVTICFDTELFGHWWFEGITFLKQMIRSLHHQHEIQIQQTSQYLQDHTPEVAIDLTQSSWGQGGHYWVWDNPETQWMWPVIHQAESRMKALVATFADCTDAQKCEILNQTGRELLLLQSSDWPFLVTTGQASEYAIERFNQHVERFNTLATMLETDTIDRDALQEIEGLDNPFPTYDYHWFDYQSNGSEQPAATPSS